MNLIALTMFPQMSERNRPLNVAERNQEISSQGAIGSDFTQEFLEQALSDSHPLPAEVVAQLLASLSELTDSEGLQAGVRAADYAYTQPAWNPYNQSNDWNGWGLGWANQAMQGQGYLMPELQAATGADALDAAEQSGRLQDGDPPPGAIVFFQDGERVRIGIVASDGQSLRTTQEADEQGRSVGEIPMPDEVLGWLEAEESDLAPATAATPVGQPNAQDPASFYLTQNATDWNPNGSINANCGPASLAMAAAAFGLLPEGTSMADPENLIETVREKMTGNRDIHQLTGDGDVMNGAQALGMNSRPVASISEVDQALAKGEMVVAGGDPSAYSNGSGGHFVLITGRDASGGYVMNDPAYTGQPGVVLTPEQFAGFFGSGVALSPKA